MEARGLREDDAGVRAVDTDGEHLKVDLRVMISFPWPRVLEPMSTPLRSLGRKVRN
jgi:hypothetical protein